MTTYSIPGKITAFLQLWFFLLTHICTAEIVLGAAFGVLIGMITLAAAPLSAMLELFVIFIITGVLFGGFIGGCIGIVTGIMTGITALIATLFFYPPRRSLLRPLVLHIVNLIVVVGTIYAADLDYVREEPYRTAYFYVPTMLASLSSYWVIQKMIHWYESTFTPTPSSQQ